MMLSLRAMLSIKNAFYEPAYRDEIGKLLYARAIDGINPDPATYKSQPFFDSEATLVRAQFQAFLRGLPVPNDRRATSIHMAPYLAIFTDNSAEVEGLPAVYNTQTGMLAARQGANVVTDFIKKAKAIESLRADPPKVEDLKAMVAALGPWAEAVGKPTITVEDFYKATLTAFQTLSKPPGLLQLAAQVVKEFVMAVQIANGLNTQLKQLPEDKKAEFAKKEMGKLMLEMAEKPEEAAYPFDFEKIAAELNALPAPADVEKMWEARRNYLANQKELDAQVQVLINLAKIMAGVQL